MVKPPGEEPAPRVNRKFLAAILVIALSAAVLVLGWLLRPTSAPTHHQQPVPTPHYLSFPAPANGTFCSGMQARHWATAPPTTAKMIDVSTGWAYGPLRTTDGGSTWINVSPPSIPNRTPINDEFFLDSKHAWVAETAGSSNACVDHVVIFRTADGGRTWQQAKPIPVRFSDSMDFIWAPTTSGVNWFSFIDAENGWLLIGSGRAAAAELGGSPGFGQHWSVGDLYRTADGGLNWTHVSSDPGSQLGCEVGAGMSFSTLTTGWIASTCGLLVTHDGGAVWGKQPLSITPTLPPTFFDALRGVAFGTEGLFLTSDGGATWTPRDLRGATYVDFVNPGDGWAVRFLGNDPMQAEFGLYKTNDGAATWTLVNAISLPPLPPDHYWRTKGEDPGAWGLDFVDSNTGYWTICGGPPGPCLGNGLFKTSDGGGTWKPVQETIRGA
jgi:photosystem II stability/assembly factor-like uncharacterized protein